MRTVGFQKVCVVCRCDEQGLCTNMQHPAGTVFDFMMGFLDLYSIPARVFGFIFGIHAGFSGSYKMYMGCAELCCIAGMYACTYVCK